MMAMQTPIINWNLRFVIHSRATSNGKESNESKETDDNRAFEER